MMRFTQQHLIEQAITALRPELDEACEILDALTAALRSRYPDELDDVLALARELREAMNEAGDVMYAAQEPDPMDLARDAWLAEQKP